MELKQLKFYLTCVECGSLGKAAEKLYTTQPNVSKVIHALEDELGGELFERTPKGMILTSFGKTIYEYAKTCVQSADALQNIGKYQQTDTFSVSTYRSNTLAKLLAQQYRCDPSVVIEHQQGTVDEILDRVERGISEIGILYIAKRQYKAFLNVLHHKKLEFHLLDYRDTCVYAGSNSPIYDRSSVTFEELPQMKFIRNLNDTFSIQNGLEHIELGVVSPQQLHTVVRTNSEHFSAAMLAETEVMDIGIYLDYPNDASEDDLIRAIYIEGENTRAALGVVVQNGHMLTPYARKFLNRLSEMFMMRTWNDTIPE